MTSVRLRIVGEWKALVSAFNHWRRISPCVKCSRCGGWFDQTDVCKNGHCWECDDVELRSMATMEENGLLDDDDVCF